MTAAIHAERVSKRYDGVLALGAVRAQQAEELALRDLEGVVSVMAGSDGARAGRRGGRVRCKPVVRRHAARASRVGARAAYPFRL